MLMAMERKSLKRLEQMLSAGLIDGECAEIASSAIDEAKATEDHNRFLQLFIDKLQKEKRDLVCNLDDYRRASKESMLRLCGMISLRTFLLKCLLAVCAIEFLAILIMNY